MIYSLIVNGIYILLICFTILGYYFNRSLENVQYYHHRLLPRIKSPVTTNELFLLDICVLCGVLYSSTNNVSFAEETKKLLDVECIYIFDNRSLTGKPQKLGFAFKASDNCLIVALCSTANIMDAIISLHNNLVSFNRSFNSTEELAKVHEGYLTRAEQLLKDVLLILCELGDTIRYVVFTGHSMGGCIAAILGALLNQFLERKYYIQVYTFGSPKYCNEDFVKYYDQESFYHINTYQNSADLVITKPLFYQYTHVGTIISWNIDTGNENVNHGIKVYRECLLKLHTSNTTFRGHRMDEILSRWILDNLG